MTGSLYWFCAWLIARKSIVETSACAQGCARWLSFPECAGVGAAEQESRCGCLLTACVCQSTRRRGFASESRGPTRQVRATRAPARQETPGCGVRFFMTPFDSPRYISPLDRFLNY